MIASNTGFYESDPKSISLEYLDARFAGAERKMREFGTKVTPEKDRILSCWQ